MIERLMALAVMATVACGDAPVEASPPVQDGSTRTAVFAGGCFWSIEAAFEAVPGVVEATSGFAGGRTASPTYAQVVAGGTGHLEAVRVTYDPARVSYRQLVDRFWRVIDPTDAGGQFCDRGPSYATAVFVAAGQRADAEASRAAAARALGGARIVTPVRDAVRFWPAGAEHQDFARRHPDRYARYVQGCRRRERLAAVWGA